MERVPAHQLGKLEEVGDAIRLLERLVELVHPADDAQVVPEFLAEPGDLLERLSQARIRARHAALVPDDPAQLLVKGIGAPLSFHGEERAEPFLHVCFGRRERRMRDVHGLQ